MLFLRVLHSLCVREGLQTKLVCTLADDISDVNSNVNDNDNDNANPNYNDDDDENPSP